jgi:hypothetical protein
MMMMNEKRNEKEKRRLEQKPAWKRLLQHASLLRADQIPAPPWPLSTPYIIEFVRFNGNVGINIIFSHSTKYICLGIRIKNSF